MDVTRWLAWLARAEGRAKSADPNEPDHVDPQRRPAPIPASLRRRCVITHEVVGSTHVTVARPRVSRTDASVIYHHGGTYSSPISALHWALVDRLVQASGATFILPFALPAPEHTLDDALSDLTAIYARARATVGHLIVAGDSSGGGLALVDALVAREHGVQLPDGLLLFSPWVDVTLTSPQSEAIEPHDPVMRMAGPRAMGRVWAGARDVRDPLVSPLYADLRGLPPMTIWQGGYDLSLPDVERFVAAARQQGNEVRFVLEPDAFHVYPVAWWTPEARRAVRLAASIIQRG